MKITEITAEIRQTERFRIAVSAFYKSFDNPALDAAICQVCKDQGADSGNMTEYVLAALNMDTPTFVKAAFIWLESDFDLLVHDVATRLRANPSLTIKNALEERMLEMRRLVNKYFSSRITREAISQYVSSTIDEQNNQWWDSLGETGRAVETAQAEHDILVAEMNQGKYA